MLGSSNRVYMSMWSDSKDTASSSLSDHHSRCNSHDLLPPLVSPVRDGQGVVVLEHGLAPHAAHLMKAVFLRLAQLVNEKVAGETEALFRVLWRFNKHSKEPPRIPRGDNHR